MVERRLAKAEVAGSSPVSRSIFYIGMAPWPSGKAEVCKTFIPGSIPGGASSKKASDGCFFVIPNTSDIRNNPVTKKE